MRGQYSIVVSMCVMFVYVHDQYSIVVSMCVKFIYVYNIPVVVVKILHEVRSSNLTSSETGLF